MSTMGGFEDYLRALERALALYPGRRAQVLDEVRDHLLEARDRAVREGCAPEEAERRALAAFGDARALARGYVAQRSRARIRLLLPVALGLGLALAWVDSRPNWDDTGMSVVAVLGASGLLGLLEPTRPYLWGAAIGGWFPLLALVLHGNPGALVALVLAFAGAYGGGLVRRVAVA